MTDEPSVRVSDQMLAEFIETQVETNRVSGLRFDNLEDVVVGPPITGSTGAFILNGDGLKVRDKTQGLANKRTLSGLMRAAILSAVAIILASGVPDLIERVWP